MAELAYALDSGSSPGNWVRVQVPLTAEKRLINSMFMSLIDFLFRDINIGRDCYHLMNWLPDK